MVEDSEVMAEDDNLWPQPDRVGRQELEIVIGKISFSLSLSHFISRSFFLSSLLSLALKSVYSLCRISGSNWPPEV